MTKDFAHHVQDFGLELIGDSEQDAGERQGQACNVGRSIQRRGMDSNGDRLDEGM